MPCRFCNFRLRHRYFICISLLSMQKTQSFRLRRSNLICIFICIWYGFQKACLRRRNWIIIFTSICANIKDFACGAAIVFCILINISCRSWGLPPAALQFYLYIYQYLYRNAWFRLRCRKCICISVVFMTNVKSFACGTAISFVFHLFLMYIS